MPSSVSSSEPCIAPASRSLQPINQIRSMLHQIPKINEERALHDLPPLLNFTIGQPHIPMNTAILDELISELQQLKNLPENELASQVGYSHPAGLPSTRQTIAQFYNHCFPNVAATNPFTAGEVLCTNGAAGALTLALQTLIEDGDQVATFSPYFPPYKDQVESCGGLLVEIPLRKETCIANSLKSCFQQHPHIKAFIWNDPNNPTGIKHSKESLLALQSVLNDFPHLMIIHDEVYRDIVHESTPLSLIDIAPHLKNRSIIIRSLAKDIAGAPGIRGGMASAPTSLKSPRGGYTNIVECMSNEQLKSIVSISIFTQMAITISLKQIMEGKNVSWEQKRNQEYLQNVQKMKNTLEDLGFPSYFPSKGAFYLIADASFFKEKSIPNTLTLKSQSGKAHELLNLHEIVGSDTLYNDLHIAQFLLHTVGIAAVPASGFSFDKELCGLRFSCACSEKEITQVSERMAYAKSFF